jgi:DNA-binding SARP family transcriptional activator
LQDRTQGWAAAIVLMLEHAKIVGGFADFPGEAPPQVVFDYLAGEIFDRFELQTQHFLMRIACLKRMTIEVAEKVGDTDKARRLLLNLAHNDYFVREVVLGEVRVYQFHPLMRDFLLSRAAVELPDAVTQSARRYAAAQLHASGLEEDAVALLIEAKDWSEVAVVAAELADTLLAQGRSDTLNAWLELLPPELLGKSPQLLLADASSRMHASPRTARHGFESALTGFRASKDRHGMIRSCCGIINATILEFDDLATLDRWRDELAELLTMGDPADAASVATLVRSTLLRDPTHPQLAAWLGLAGRFNGAPNDKAAARINLARVSAALLQGDFSSAQAIAGGIVALTADPATQIGIALTRALHQLLDGDPGMAQAAARDGILLAQAQGVNAYHAWLHMLIAASALGLGDCENARIEIKNIEALDLRRGDRAVLHYLGGWLAALDGESSQAQREFRSSLVLAGEAGIPWIEWFARVAMAQALCASGDHQGAAAQARSLSALFEKLGGPLLQIATLLTDANIARTGQGEEASLIPLHAAFSLGRQQSFRHIVGLLPGLVSELSAVALRYDIESEFARTLIRFGRLAPPAGALRLKQWPWSYQVVSLGEFSLTHGKEAIEFSAKGAGRPVELLKVLVALGGKNVRADQLADALWPHVDADYAHKSFTQTLHRLRGYFSDEDAIVLRDGRLSLNSSLFWIDTWALEHLIAELDAWLRNPDATAAESALKPLMDELIMLYAGAFLPDEDEQPSYIACREQFRARLLRIVTRVAHRWEETGRSEAAVDYYLRCIHADELCEPFYRNLMLCYRRRDETADALATYERLRTVLVARLKCIPSPEAQKLHASLRSGSGGTF